MCLRPSRAHFPVFIRQDLCQDCIRLVLAAVWLYKLSTPVVTLTFPNFTEDGERYVLAIAPNDDGAVFGLDIFKNNGGCRRRTISEAITL